MSATSKAKNPVLKGIGLLNLFQDLYRDIPVQAIETFLHVAYKGEIHQMDLIYLLDIHQASVSRNVALLSGWNRHREEGLGLVDYREDPYDRRKQIIFLTEKGKKLKKEIEELLS